MRFVRSVVTGTVLALAPHAFAGVEPAAANTPPSGAQNVLVLVIDDCGPGLIGAYDDYFQGIGRPSQTPALTPAIDTLIAQPGLTFTRAWSSPLCTPARSMMLTGRWGFRTGLGCVLRPPGSSAANPGLQSSERLLPQLLHKAANPFTCVALGKWHLADSTELALNPFQPLGSPPGTWFDRFAGTIFNLGDATTGPPQSTGYYAWDKYYASQLVPGVRPCRNSPVPCVVPMNGAHIDSYPSVDTTDDALTMLSVLPEPWFLWVSYHAIHDPYQSVPAGLPTSACGAYVPPSSPCNAPPNANDGVRARCMLEALDGQIGRLMCAVNPADTTVILLGDNGTPKSVTLPPYPQLHGKGSVYQGGVEVPLIVRSPLLAPNLVGTTCDALVHTLDLFATVCDLAQLDPSAWSATDSVSLVPYLLAPAPSQRTTLYTEDFEPNFIPSASGGLPAGYVASEHDQALTDGRFKLIRRWRRDHAGGVVLREELYDLEQGGPPDANADRTAPTPDWFEANDLLAAASSTSSAAMACAALRAELDALYPTVVR